MNTLIPNIHVKYFTAQYPTKNVDIYSRHVSGITFIGYAHSRKIVKPNNLKVLT